MSRQAKLEHSLETLEAEMLETVLPLLRATATRRYWLFCTRRHSDYGHMSCRAMNDLLDLADEARKLRSKLGMEWEGSIGELLDSACREWASPENPGAQAIAFRLLGQLGHPLPGLR